MLTFTLPYLPPVEFSGNYRGHWTARYKAGEKVKNDVIALIREQEWSGPPLGTAIVTVAWGLPDRRRRDWDNLFASTKPILDGLKAAGVIKDDSVRDISPVLIWYYSPGKPECRVTIEQR
jgi:Holliday junction resolvase RusA-like endonuclease